MLLNAPAMERLVDAFRQLPGIGRRSAERLALHILTAPAEEAAALGDAIAQARRRITTCSRCCDLTEGDPCAVCADPARDHSLICVVERPAGAIAIEKGRGFRGGYHVLHGALNPLEGIGPDELTVEHLLHRLDHESVEEVIIATNATAEGEATAHYLGKLITAKGVAVSRIAHGVPMGGGLEYADDATLSHALDGRIRL